MSRSTQFIGLTKSAEDFVKDLEKVNCPEYGTTGMFEEHVPLRKWLYSDRHIIAIQEIVQCVPWSSGPMIFTCLSFVYDNGPYDGNKFLTWVPDPRISNQEFDKEKGIYWV